MTIEIDRIRSIGIGRVAIAGWEGDTIEGGRRGGLLRGRFSMKNQHRHFRGDCIHEHRQCGIFCVAGKSVPSIMCFPLP
jgi:hypothetical protein